jgi:hypothetical protein
MAVSVLSLLLIHPDIETYERETSRAKPRLPAGATLLHTRLQQVTHVA